MQENQKLLLKKARDTYGNKNQILVCMEELNELACVLAKYPRYTQEVDAVRELHDKVLDEVADVTVILEHVKEILNITEDELDERISKKLSRLERWLDHSTSMEETTIDRAVDGDTCKQCYWKSNNEHIYQTRCVPCLKAQATEGRAVNYKPIG